MDLLKLVLVVIMFLGVFLFMMVYDIENFFIKVDMFLLRNVGVEL